MFNLANTEFITILNRLNGEYGSLIIRMASMFKFAKQIISIGGGIKMNKLVEEATTTISLIKPHLIKCRNTPFYERYKLI